MDDIRDYTNEQDQAEYADEAAYLTWLESLAREDNERTNCLHLRVGPQPCAQCDERADRAAFEALNVINLHTSDEEIWAQIEALNSRRSRTAATRITRAA